MPIRLRDPYRGSVLRTRRRVALRSFVAGAALCLALVAAPLWLMDSGVQPVVTAQPLLSLSTAPAQPSQFNVGDILAGDWVGEMCPDGGVPVPIQLSFSNSASQGMVYTLQSDMGNALGSGKCEVEGQRVAFHTFLAILSDCDEACGVDRSYTGQFEDGYLVGEYSDDSWGERCGSCVGGGTWWLEPKS